MGEETRIMWETNRTRRQRPKSGYAWCPGCDRCLVRDGQRCPVCGSLHKPGKFKKIG